MTVATAAAVRAGDDRAALARTILARAEERTGTSRWVRPVRLPDVASGAVATGEVVAALAQTGLVLPVDGLLADLLPSRGLDRGSTVVVTGSTGLVLGLLAEASRSGGWVALVGLPGLGVLAASSWGSTSTVWCSSRTPARTGRSSWRRCSTGWTPSSSARRSP